MTAVGSWNRMYNGQLPERQKELPLKENITDNTRDLCTGKSNNSQNQK